MNNESILNVSDITKTFGATKALTNVSIDFFRGEIHGLIGENGSGKSTVSNVVMGVHQPDGGSMTLRGELYAPGNMMEAIAHGVCMVVQEMATINDLTVADNVFLGCEKNFVKGGIVDKNMMCREAKTVLEQIGLVDIDPRASINSLSFEDRKLVEVGRAMYHDPDILIVDETTTALSQRGRNIMYEIMHKMADAGKSVILISHDIEELMKHADKVSVLRDGCFVRTVDKEDLDENLLKTLMIGRELGEHYYREDYEEHTTAETVLKVEDAEIFLPICTVTHVDNTCRDE